MNVPSTQTLQENHKGDLLYYTFPAFDAMPFVRHGFSTRLGGVSIGKFASMNLSFTRGDEEEAVLENFRRFCAAIHVKPQDVVVSAQTHTVNIYNATAADRGRGITRAREYTDVDGLITDEPNVVLCTQYADCVPLFFVDPVKKVVATSHAGWRGTLGGIGRLTVERMCSDYGCLPENIRVGIGPSIGRCCFEVDDPVFMPFAQSPLFDEGCYTNDGNGKYHIDLWEYNRRSVLSAGVKACNITVTDLCPRCHPSLLWSHRYCGKDRGSLAAFISIAED